MNFGILFQDKSILVTFLASFVIWFMFGGLVILWIVDGRFKKEEAIHALFSVLLAWVIAEMLKSIFAENRPFMNGGFVPSTITVPTDSSFPSMHSAIAFALAVSVYLHDKKTGNKFLFLAILVAMGRILSGVHYLTDVLAGTFIGITIAYFVGKIHLFGLLRKK